MSITGKQFVMHLQRAEFGLVYGLLQARLG